MKVKHNAFVTKMIICVLWIPALLSPIREAWANFCPALPPPTGSIIEAASVQEILNAVAGADEGDTIMIANGTYNTGTIEVYTPGISIRSASGNRNDVILNSEYGGDSGLIIFASNTTVADITIANSGKHGIHVMPSQDSDTLNTRIYNVRIVDPGQKAIQITHGLSPYFADDGEIACSELELTDMGRSEILRINDKCYTGGAHGHRVMGWSVRDNVIKGFWCEEDLAGPAVIFATGSRDNVVERNQLVDNARGIWFGINQDASGRTYDDDPCPEAAGEYVDHYGGIIRNNHVFAESIGLFNSAAGLDTGIAVWQACHVDVVHNSVAFLSTPYSGIEYRFSNTISNIVNNLTTHNLRRRDSAQAYLAGNLTYQPLDSFRDASAGDLHLHPLASDAIDQGAAVSSGLCDEDADGEPRPMRSARDIGADEIGNLVKSFQTGSWELPGTWEFNYIPGSDDMVVIGVSTQVDLSSFAESAFLGFENDSNLEISNTGRLVIGGDSGNR